MDKCSAAIVGGGHQSANVQLPKRARLDKIRVRRWELPLAYQHDSYNFPTTALAFKPSGSFSSEYTS